MRLSLICALSITTIFSILLIAFHGAKFIGNPAVWVSSSRDSSAIIVQIIAANFGFSQSYTALSIPRINTSLYTWQVLLTGALLIFTHLFSAVWAGAITPLTTTRRSPSGNISIPAYPQGVQPNLAYDYGAGLVDPQCSHTDLVSNCAVFDLYTSIIESLKTATNPAGPRLHAKLDNTTWTYQGRSYGVGVSQGLTEVLDNSTDLYTAYSYFENGYLTEVSCEFNTSSN